MSIPVCSLTGTPLKSWPCGDEVGSWDEVRSEVVGVDPSADSPSLGSGVTVI